MNDVDKLSKELRILGIGMVQGWYRGGTGMVHSCEVIVQWQREDGAVLMVQ